MSYDLFTEPAGTTYEPTDDQTAVLKAFHYWGALQDQALKRAYSDWQAINGWPKIAPSRLIEVRQELTRDGLLAEIEAEGLPSRLEGQPVWSLTQYGYDTIG